MKTYATHRTQHISQKKTIAYPQLKSHFINRTQYITEEKTMAYLHQKYHHNPENLSHMTFLNLYPTDYYYSFIRYFASWHCIQIVISHNVCTIYLNGQFQIPVLLISWRNVSHTKQNSTSNNNWMEKECEKIYCGDFGI